MSKNNTGFSDLKKKKYSESQRVSSAYSDYSEQKKQKPDNYSFSDSNLLAEKQSEFLSPKDFKYDANSDPSFSAYKNTYLTQGKKAMEDTVGTASALSGGYGNSYAATAGNIAYNEAIDKLNDIYPELYSAAYSRYSDDLDRLESQLSFLSDKDAKEYDRYSDANNAYFKELDALRQFYLDESKKDISAYENEWEAAYKLAVSESDKEKFDDELAFKYAVAEKEDRDRDFELQLEDEKLANQNEQFWAEFNESNKEFLRDDELYVLLGNGGYYEVMKALDMQYSDPDMARLKALSMNIKKEYVDAYFNSKYSR